MIQQTSWVVNMNYIYCYFWQDLVSPCGRQFVKKMVSKISQVTHPLRVWQIASWYHNITFYHETVLTTSYKLYTPIPLMLGQEYQNNRSWMTLWSQTGISIKKDPRHKNKFFISAKSFSNFLLLWNIKTNMENLLFFLSRHKKNMGRI